jgi:hypothetical protein
MVIDDLHVVGISLRAAKTQTPLIVYPNAKLPLAITLEGLQSVRRRYAQIIDASGNVEHLKLSPSNYLKGAEPLRRLSAIEGFRVLAAKRLDHG